MVTTQLQELQSMNPWPDIHGLDGQPAYVWSLDGGGRHLIVDLIASVNRKFSSRLACSLAGRRCSGCRTRPTI